MGSGAAAIVVFSLVILANCSEERVCPRGRLHTRHQPPSQAQACKMPRLQFVFFGDSLTERGFEHGGWGAGMTDLYRRKVRIFLSQNGLSFAVVSRLTAEGPVPTLT